MKINCDYNPFYGDLIMDFNGEKLSRLRLSSEQVKNMLYALPLGVIEEIVTRRGGGMPKELECIKDDIEYIMEKAAKCKDRDKLRSILEALEVITAEI